MIGSGLYRLQVARSVHLGPPPNNALNLAGAAEARAIVLPRAGRARRVTLIR